MAYILTVLAAGLGGSRHEHLSGLPLLHPLHRRPSRLPWRSLPNNVRQLRGHSSRRLRCRLCQIFPPFLVPWTTASLRSALMTTASHIPPSLLPNSTIKSTKLELDCAYGSGQIDLLPFVKPGLVYGLTESSYLRFLCSKHPNNTAVAILTGSRNIDCAPYSKGKLEVIKAKEKQYYLVRIQYHVAVPVLGKATESLAV
ncbi:hypothetical protein M5K25_018668 [Dendrobium thyrsiflorum]|uniref:Uncharacterized protein n=1 Tax=Dendrobium thyrsiflorum TaxID=117978 RepID=A0ABD0UIV4_DENTH